MEREVEGVEGDEQPAGSQPHDVQEPGENEAGAPSEVVEEAAAESDEVQSGDEVEQPEGDGEQPEGEAADEKPKSKVPEGVQRRIGELTAKRREAEERATKAEARVKLLEESAGSHVPLHPDWLESGEAELMESARGLEERESFLIEHIVDGYEDAKDPSKSLTPQEVAKELARLRQSGHTVARAQAVYEQRKAQFLADARAGRALRLAKVKQPAAGAAGGKPKPGAPAVKPSGAAGSRPVQSSVERRGMSEKRFVESGGDRAAAERELARL